MARINRRNEEQTIGKAMESLLRSYQLEDKLREVNLVNSWKKVMGPTVASRTTQLLLNDKKLFVSLNSASLRQELNQAKQRIVTLLNEEAGAPVIAEIIFQ